MCKWGIKATQVKLYKSRLGRTHTPIDPCIASLVQALNGAKIETWASCCGHNSRPGAIALADGRELFIFPDFESSRKLEKTVFKQLGYKSIGGEEL